METAEVLSNLGRFSLIRVVLTSWAGWIARHCRDADHDPDRNHAAGRDRRRRHFHGGHDRSISVVAARQ
jgi:hypothetical protein